MMIPIILGLLVSPASTSKLPTYPESKTTHEKNFTLF